MKLRANRIVSLLFGGALLAPVAAVAQVGASDAGTFEVRIAGRQVGTEEFRIQQSGGGSGAEIVATGRVRLVMPSGTLDLTPTLRTTGFQAEPVSYEVAIGGTSPRRIVGSVREGRFSARIATASGEQFREYVASAGATILDDGVAHHYYFLARRTHDGRIPVIIPRENRQVMATVRTVGAESVSIGNESATLYHLEVQPDGGDARHVWVDDLERQAQALATPEAGSQRLVALRHRRQRALQPVGVERPGEVDDALAGEGSPPFAAARRLEQPGAPLLPRKGKGLGPRSRRRPGHCRSSLKNSSPIATAILRGPENGFRA